MARLTDHDIRDAEHALRTETALLLGKYGRRVLEEGKAGIQQEMEEARREGRSVDGTAVGRAAFAKAAGNYFVGLGTPQPAIESEGHSTRV